MYDLKRFRSDKKIKQTDVSEKTGIDQARISKYENGIDLSEYVSAKLIKAFPDLKSYKIEDKLKEAEKLEYQASLKTKILKQEAVIEELRRIIREFSESKQ